LSAAYAPPAIVIASAANDAPLEFSQFYRFLPIKMRGPGRRIC
jgi:hypothetical protein